MATKNRNFLTALWDFFCSLKLTITTLILLALTSIIGTVIEQGRSPQEYLQVYSKTTCRIIESLQLNDMYHSWWFLTLLGVFSINLIACSIKRLPRVWKTVKNPVLAPGDTLYRTLSNMDEVVVKEGTAKDLEEKLSGFLRQNFAAPRVTEEGDKVHLFAQKMAWARFGVYVTHLSILIIFIGAIIGNVWGFKAFVNIVEGTTATQVWPRGSNEPLDLGFQVRCDDFNVTYYEGSNRPKEFTSILDVIDSGDEVIHDRRIEVNHPLTYRGITFYQSSYGAAGDPSFTFRVKQRETGKTVEVSAPQGQRMALPGGAYFRVADYAPSFQNFGPAARIEVFPRNGQPRSFVVLKAFPQFDAQRGGEYVFAMTDVDQRFYTGLQVAKDPGVWVVWAGCFLMVVGSLVAFFLSHRRIWMTIQPIEGNRLGIKFGGSAHRNQPAFELFFEDFKKKLKTHLES